MPDFSAADPDFYIRLASPFLRTFTQWLERKSVHSVRALERCLPVPILSMVLWPAAVLWTLIEFKTHLKAVASWSRFPPQWKPNRFIYTFRQTLGFSHSRLVYLWPDRLPDPRWRARCALRADYDLEKLLSAERPIIFASLHFGPFRSLPYLLRAHGIPATTLIGSPVSARSAWIDRHSPPADVPVLASVNDIREIRRSLVGKRRLLILMDVARGRLVPIPFEDQVFRMATGALRLAASTGALLVPCLLVEKKVSWDFSIHFGSPVPDELLGQTADLEPAANHLFHQFLPVLEAYPAHCRHRLLNSITPASVDASVRNECAIAGATPILRKRMVGLSDSRL